MYAGALAAESVMASNLTRLRLFPIVIPALVGEIHNNLALELDCKSSFCKALLIDNPSLLFH
jgi:hypothetical protein